MLNRWYNMSAFKAIDIFSEISFTLKIIGNYRNISQNWTLIILPLESSFTFISNSNSLTFITIYIFHHNIK